MEYRRLRDSKIVWVGLVGLVALIGIIVYTLSSNGKSVGVSGPAEVTPGVNTSVNVGSFDVTVTAVSEKTAADMKTVSLDVSAYNRAKSADQFYGDQVVLRDKSGSEYKAETGGFGRATINPGITEKGTLTYKVPANAEITSAMIRAEMIDTGGAKYTRIDLTK
jgi:hypothetical protein